MRIKEVTEEYILFDNNYKITYDHNQDCCEWNFADFNQVEPLALTTEFDEDLKFEAVKDGGFRFGNSGKMFFVPCYSVQSGYYSTDVDIYYKGERVLNTETEEL